MTIHANVQSVDLPMKIELIILSLKILKIQSMLVTQNQLR